MPPSDCLFLIPDDASSIPVIVSKSELRKRITLIRCALVPSDSLGLVFRNISAAIIGLGQRKLRFDISLLGLCA
jgi:hypothetical protein